MIDASTSELFGQLPVECSKNDGFLNGFTIFSV